jgi:hypothetical protein
MKKLVFLFLIFLFTVPCFSQTWEEDLYKEFDLNSPLSWTTSLYVKTLQYFQRKNLSITTDDSCTFSPTPPFFKSKNDVQFFCSKTNERIYIYWEKMRGDYTPYYLFISYSLYSMGDCYNAREDTSRILFLFREDGTGGYFRRDVNGSIFLGGPDGTEVAFSVANEKEILILRKRLVDIFSILWRSRQTLPKGCGRLRRTGI